MVRILIPILEPDFDVSRKRVLGFPFWDVYNAGSLDGDLGKAKFLSLTECGNMAIFSWTHRIPALSAVSSPIFSSVMVAAGAALTRRLDGLTPNL
eukprot:COSAG02_NODE_2073_length_9931_cov_12.650020_8_plen_95_part_00